MRDRHGVCRDKLCICNEPEPCEECASKDADIADLKAENARLVDKRPTLEVKS